jgi:hypothetical protein
MMTRTTPQIEARGKRGTFWRLRRDKRAMVSRIHRRMASSLLKCRYMTLRRQIGRMIKKAFF